MSCAFVRRSRVITTEHEELHVLIVISRLVTSAYLSYYEGMYYNMSRRQASGSVQFVLIFCNYCTILYDVKKTDIYLTIYRVHFYQPFSSDHALRNVLYLIGRLGGHK